MYEPEAKGHRDESEAAARHGADRPHRQSSSGDASPSQPSTGMSDKPSMVDGDSSGADPSTRARRRRGNRGGRRRSRPTGADTLDQPVARSSGSGDAEESAKPKIGDSRPAPVAAADEPTAKEDSTSRSGKSKSSSSGSGSGRSGRKRSVSGRSDRPTDGAGDGPAKTRATGSGKDDQASPPGGRRRRRSRGRGRKAGSEITAVTTMTSASPVELDEKTLEQRRGRERKGRPVGRYLMAVHVAPQATQISVLEGRNLIEHYVSKRSDDDTQIHGHIYLGRVQNVLPGMEAAFIDIGTPKNAVLYHGDVRYDVDDIEGGRTPRIEEILKSGQSIICQVTKNPIAHKGARLTQEVSLPGRFVVLIPNSSTYGISKRLPDEERKRLRAVLDRVRPGEHGIIVRTAAESVTEEEIEADVLGLVEAWRKIEANARAARAPSLLYREPDMALRVIREEFNKNYRSVVIDDQELYGEVQDYVSAITPALADRIEYYDAEAENLPLFERHHVHQQLHKALDRKVWLPSGGSLIIEHTEALTVIDVNTGRNVGNRSLEETVFANNLEAAVEVARQLRLRDIGGIIVIDFVDMENKANRAETIKVFRDALARDKTRTQVFDISELGLVEMTRKRIGEGLLESLSGQCPECEGHGVVFDAALLENQ